MFPLGRSFQCLALRNIVNSIKPFSVYTENNPTAKLRLEIDQMPIACVPTTCLARSFSNLATVLAQHEKLIKF